MWEKISKEMQLPWRAAEAMHWQIGEVEMAQRANVPVFHLAGQQGSMPSQMGPMSDGGMPNQSTSPSSMSGIVQMGNGAYMHTHNHSLPQHYHHPPQQQQQQAGAQQAPLSPTQTRLRRNSSDSSPSGHPSFRRRADSARSVPAASGSISGLSGRGSSGSISGQSRGILPPVGELTASQQQNRYTLPPVVTSGADMSGRR